MGTFLVTLGAAYSIKYGQGKACYNRAVNWMEHKLTGIFNPSTARKFSEQCVETTALMQGGNLMLLPIGILEHYKVKIVSGLNTMMGDSTPPEKVEASPKQTWWSLIEGRALAWTAVFITLFSASLVVPKSFQMFKSEFAERAHGLIGKVRASRSSGVMQETKAFKIGELAALDIFATAAAATLLYVGGHFFARRHEEKKEIREARRHLEGTPQMRDAGEDVSVSDKALVSAEISGEKQYDGKLAARAAAMTNGLAG